MRNQVLDFILYFFIGFLLSCIFDFFRGYRIFKKNEKKYINKNIVLFQDIICFTIDSIIIVITNVYVLKCGIRFYLIISLITGVILYFNFFSKYIVKLYLFIFRINKEIINFIFIPFCIFGRIFEFLKNYVIKACKFTKNMILYMIRLILRKRKFNYEKK